MIILEYKVKAKQAQYDAMDEAIRTAQFIRNKALRLWMDAGKEDSKSKYDLNKYCRVLAKEFDFASRLNSTARKASAERAWSAISNFYARCKDATVNKKCAWALPHSSPPAVSRRETAGKCGGSNSIRAGSAGYPKFKKYTRSVEYKKSGWKLDETTKKHITFTDGNNIGRVKLVGSRDIYFYDSSQIQRVRIVRRADGYYVQFGVAIDRVETVAPTGKVVGLDVGLKQFYSDSNAHQEPNPRFYRTNEKRLNKLNRRKSKKYRKGQRQSANYHRARQRYARLHLRVSRQRIEHAKRLARCVILSNDLVAYEDLRVANMVRNGKLAKFIADTGWSQFRAWLEYFGRVFGKVTVAVPPQHTSQNCSSCGEKVHKTLSTRTHRCTHCGYTEDRDVNAAINILQLGLRTTGHVGTHAWGDGTATSVGESLLEQVAS